MDEEKLNNILKAMENITYLDWKKIRRWCKEMNNLTITSQTKG